MDENVDAPVKIRRELHALKGASRMMGFRQVAELCHRAEDLLESPELVASGEFEECLAEIAKGLEALAGARDEEQTTGDDPQRSREKPAEPRRGRREEIRVAAELVDDLADRGARLRVVAVAAEGLANRIFRLAALSERGVGERAPRQVLATLATSLRQVAMELEGGQRILRRLTERQLDALLHLQVQPLKPFLKGLAGHASELADALGKRVEVEVVAGDAQLDRRIVEGLREALLHLVRNAVDHGIESPDQRAKAGKDPVGHIRLETSNEGDRVRLQIVDDGRGIDCQEVVATAIRRELITEEAAERLTTSEVLQFLFRPGFTTRETKTELSGRGIGLDAVAATVRSAGGDLWMESESGSGTVITVEVPLARRGERVLVLEVGQHRLAMPAAPAQAYRRVTAEQVEETEGHRVVRIGDRTIAARFLADAVGEPAAGDGVLVEMVIGGGVVGIVADSVVGEEEVIIHPLPAAAGAPPVMEGITLLASGRPVFVLSLQRLGPIDALDTFDRPVHGPRPRPIQVLLVDDSVVTREMVRRLLEDGGFGVTSVGSAEDALQALENRDFDCVVTDIEMPGMDGLGLTRELRGDPRLADLPIVVVSTLDRPADRLAGLEAGADAYLTKQGLDARELVALVYRVGGGG
jgi:chemotaxis protein histidine kinase CheA/CheY-like chemotaxis protein